MERRRFSVTQASEGGESMSIMELDARIDKRIADRLNAFAETLRKQSDDQYERLEALIKSGFPEGDPVEHRIAHEEMIRMVRARRRFFEQLALHLAKGGVWALFLFLGIAIWQWVKAQINSAG